MKLKNWYYHVLFVIILSLLPYFYKITDPFPGFGKLFFLFLYIPLSIIVALFIYIFIFKKYKNIIAGFVLGVIISTAIVVSNAIDVYGMNFCKNNYYSGCRFPFDFLFFTYIIAVVSTVFFVIRYLIKKNKFIRNTGAK